MDLKKPKGMPKEVWMHVQRLENKSLESRMSNTAELGRLEHKSAVKPLIEKTLKDKNMWGRWTGIKALGEIGDEKAIKPLTQKMLDKNEDENIKFISGYALANIGERIRNKKTKNYYAKALQLIQPFLHKEESYKIVAPAFEEALKIVQGKKRVTAPQPHLNLYLKQLRTMQGKMK